MINCFSFIGAGNMAKAIISGIKTKDIFVYDIDSAKTKTIENDRIHACNGISDVLTSSDCIFLAVKPQNFNDILASISQSGVALDGKTFISIAAGITIEKIESYLPGAAIIRTMPNAPLMIAHGVTALCRNNKVNDKVFNEICHLFSEIGKVTVTDEDKLDAITAATSSSPAYLYLFVDSICSGAEKLGLNKDEMLPLVTAMINGSLGMIEHTKKTPSELIDIVKSPKGTTEAALNVFEKMKFREAIEEGMKACAERAKELSSGGN